MIFIKRLFDCIFLSRPMLWIPVWGFSLFGYAASRRIVWNEDAWFRIAPGDAAPFLLMAAFSASVGCVYVLNQIADREVDLCNPGFTLLAHGKVPLFWAWISAAVMTAISIVVPLLMHEPVVALLAVGSIILGTVYSFKPLRLSGRPIVDFLANAFGYGVIAFGAGWWCGGYHYFDKLFFLHAMPYVLMMAAGSISSTLPDIDGDRDSGKITTAVAVGERNAHRLATLLLGGALLWANAAGDNTAMAASAVAIPLYIVFLIVKKPWIREGTYKVGGAAAMVLAGLRFPPLAAAAVLVLVVTVLYFRYRFGVRYPSLLPAGTIGSRKATSPIGQQ